MTAPENWRDRFSGAMMGTIAQPISRAALMILKKFAMFFLRQCLDKFSWHFHANIIPQDFGLPA